MEDKKESIKVPDWVQKLDDILSGRVEPKKNTPA